MAKLVLFTGGDGGGLIIAPDGVRSVPPFDPLVRAQVKAVSQLVVATSDRPSDEADYGESSPGEMDQIAARLASLTVEQVEAIFGPLDPQASLIVLERDGSGFVCGTTGKAPTRLPAPPKELPAAAELLARGGIDRSLVALVERATEEGHAIEEVLDRPIELAGSLGIELSDRTARDLTALTPEHVDQLDDPVAREVVTFFRHVLSDGRFVDTWAIQPSAVSRALEVPLSDEAVDRIVAVGASFRRGMEPAGIIWIVVGIVVIVGVVIAPGDAEIVDRSGRPKF